MRIRRGRSFTRLAICHAKFPNKISGILGSMNKQTRRSVINLQAKKVMEQAKVLEIKVHTQQFDDRSDKTGLVASDYDIIHIE